MKRRKFFLFGAPLLMVLAGMIACSSDDNPAPASKLPQPENSIIGERGQTFLKEGKTWNCKLVQSGPDSYTEYYKNVIRGDSIVDGTLYFKMFRETDIISELDFYALWRENGGKVFAYVPYEGKERLMYDFSTQPGSVVACEGANTQIETTIIVTVGDRDFNCLSVLVYDDHLVTWVEGVGSPFGPTNPLGPLFTDGKKTELLSCYEEGKLIFESADFNKAHEMLDRK